MSIKKQKYTLIGIAIALGFWLLDSSIHLFLYGEERFEVFPHDFNEFWMRSAILLLIAFFGIYVDSSIIRLHKVQEERNRLNDKLQKTLTLLLGNFVSICCACKKVRIPDMNGKGCDVWESIESYISHHANMQFSHGYCPECERKLNKEIDDRISLRRSASLVMPRQARQNL